MSIEQAKAFQAKVNADEGLRDQMLRTANEKNGVDLVALGREHGFEFTAEDADAVLDAKNDELNDFELELVAAATASNCNSDPLG
ncbi:Nif11-like leader peptide family natural product precursor [bacterium]|nr:Nif11-like leader peptide family natural product precursor [bacterium]